MKKNTFKYFIAACALLFSSCTDWLTEVNPNSTASDSYWKDLTETNATLNSSYAALLSDFAVNIAYEAPRSDMATPGFGRPTYTGNFADWYNHVYNSSSKSVSEKWAVLYNGIFRANQVIEGLEGLSTDDNMEEWTLQMAQARFLRGMYHFYLHSTYNEGKIIIVDRVPGEYDELLRSLSPSEEVIDFFREDLIYAYNNLPLEWEDSKDTGRATKGAAATMLGNSLLYEATEGHVGNVDMALIDSAMVMYNNVVESGVYALETDMSKLFTTAGEYNKESIFEIGFSTTINTEFNLWAEDRATNHLAFYFDGCSANASNIFPSLWATYGYLTEELDSKDLRNKVDRLVDESETETIDRPVSLRASAMIALVQDEYTPYYSGLVHNKISFPNYNSGKAGQNGFSRYKAFNNHDYLTDESDLIGGKQNSGKNVTLNRLAEVYLNLAECHIYRGEVSEALQYINKIRRRWGLVNIGQSNSDLTHDYDEVVYDAVSLLKRLQTVEKPLEMSVEGHAIRWFDLRRWGLLSGAENIFTQRSQVRWYSEDYYVTQGEEADKTKECSTISLTPNSENTTQIELSDYGQAANNFSYEDQAWLPIPSDELLANPNL